MHHSAQLASMLIICMMYLYSVHVIALFTVVVFFFIFALQCNPTWIRDNFGLNLQNSPKLRKEPELTAKRAIVSRNYHQLVDLVD